MGAILVWWVAERNIATKYVTEERAKWREEIRELAEKIHDAILRGDFPRLRRLRRQLEMRLNPTDDEDKAILASVKDHNRDEFFKGISRMLKHDWERAKVEARFWPNWIWRVERDGKAARLERDVQVGIGILTALLLVLALCAVVAHWDSMIAWCCAGTFWVWIR
ncbi:MAG: hypothetical protein OXU75_00055 [Deltaproteobacteria bacterium]|nr:hypothetical protein [Deltaproteobacteria bacterium]